MYRIPELFSKANMGDNTHQQQIPTDKAYIINMKMGGGTNPRVEAKPTLIIIDTGRQQTN